MRRPRGPHRGLPKRPTPAGDGWRAKVTSAAAPVVASVEPRVASAAEWLFERRLHVLIVASTVATIAMIGGAVALISFASAPQPDDEAADGRRDARDVDRPDVAEHLRADPAESRSGPDVQADDAGAVPRRGGGGRPRRPTPRPIRPPSRPPRSPAVDPTRRGTRTSPTSRSPDRADRRGAPAQAAARTRRRGCAAPSRWGSRS